MTSSHLASSVEQLEKQITGSILTSDDPQYEQTRHGFNLAIDQHPALILVADNVQDIVAGVRFAREHKLGVCVQLTGHGVQYPADDNLLIVTSRLKSVQIDAEARTAQVGAGAIFQDVLDKCLEHGLAPLMGTSPRVGVVGYTLGGGVGWLSRPYGFAVDSVHWIEIVTADGEVRRASATENTDLFWALHGGGGNFGVVTAMEFSLYPVSTIYGGGLTYPPEVAGEAMRFFRDWTRDLPDEMASSVSIMKFPPLPQLPEAIRGKTFVFVRAAFSGVAAAGEALMKPWLDWKAPLSNTLHAMPFRDIPSIQNDPTDPAGSFVSNEMFDTLTDETIDIIVRYATQADSPLIYNEIRHVGGMMKRADAATSAIGNRDANFYFLIGGITPTPQAFAGVQAYTQKYKAELQPQLHGGAYLNFMRGDEVRNRTKDAYEPSDYEKLVALKTKYDPANMFRYSYQLVKTEAVKA